MARRLEAPEVNAGSMADIAFLLLIFFLVTTSIETDAGLDRMLPRKELIKVPPVIAERNILPVLINGEDQLMVDGDRVELNELKGLTIAFLDNGGASRESDNYCAYCQGNRDMKSSDNPDRAIVSLMSSRQTTYGVYIAVQNELMLAYNSLRDRESQRRYKTDFTFLEAAYSSSETPNILKSEIKEKMRSIQKLYPIKLSEAARQ